MARKTVLVDFSNRVWFRNVLTLNPFSFVSSLQKRHNHAFTYMLATLVDVLSDFATKQPLFGLVYRHYPVLFSIIRVRRYFSGLLTWIWFAQKRLSKPIPYLTRLLHIHIIECCLNVLLYYLREVMRLVGSSCRSWNWK